MASGARIGSDSGMTVTAASFEAELQELRLCGARLGAALARAADDLRAHGLEPAPGLCADVDSFRQRFDSLRSQLDDGASATGAAIASLHELEQEWSWRRRRQTALSLVERAAALRHVDEAEFAPLARVRSACQEARAQLGAPQGGCEVIEELEAGRHPLAALAALAGDPSGLSDDRWEACQDCVTEHFGRELATAALRRRLVDSAGA